MSKIKIYGELTSGTTEKGIISSDEIIDKDSIKKELFIDIWNSLCAYNNIPDYFGKYNEETGYFELNGITDIDYEEALRIYIKSYNTSIPGTNTGCTMAFPFALYYSNGYEAVRNTECCRTYFPIWHSAYEGLNLTRMFCNNNKLVTFSYVGGYGVSKQGTTFGGGCSLVKLEYAFRNCSSLIAIPKMGRVSTNRETFLQCVNLEEAWFDKVLYDIHIEDCPKIKLECFQYTITNRSTLSPEKVITITVHPDIMAKMEDETNTEWHALIEAAAEKNIVFATAT